MISAIQVNSPIPPRFKNLIQLRKISESQTIKDRQHFRPPEFLWGDTLVTRQHAKYFRGIFEAREAICNEENGVEEINNTYDVVHENEIDLNNKDWSLELSEANKEKIERLIIRLQKEENLTRDEAIAFLQYSVENIDRRKDWAEVNESKGEIASNYATASMAIGIVKSVAETFLYDENDEAFSELSPYAKSMISLLNIIEGYTLGMRGKNQFKIFTGRPDDDGAMNMYQAEVYGNKPAGFFASKAGLLEGKLNPYLLPLVGTLSPSVRDAIVPLLTLPNNLWWKVRLPGLINQEITTDALNYIVHKPLSLLGVENSKKVIQDVKQNGVFDLSYITKRLYELSSLKGEHNLINLSKHLITQCKNLFSNDYEKQLVASNNLDHFFSPILGTIGATSCAIFIPIKSICNLLGIHNKTIDYLASVNKLTHGITYIPRMTMKELVESKDLSKEYGSSKEAQALAIDKKNLFYVGLTSNFLNIACFLLKLLPTDNQVINFARNISKELSLSSILYFFSKRRNLKGEETILRNKLVINGLKK